MIIWENGNCVTQFGLNTVFGSDCHHPNESNKAPVCRVGFELELTHTYWSVFKSSTTSILWFYLLALFLCV